MITIAKWISAPFDTKSAASSFKKSFTVPVSKKVAKATLSVSAMGLF